MNVYQYIAYSNPDAANELCNRYGYYQIQTVDELAYCLQSIVARKGETALKEVMELHPDKDVVLELFETKLPPKMEAQETKRDCPCTMLNADGMASIASFANANANANTNNNIASQTNLMILAAALIVSISIISMKK